MREIEIKCRLDDKAEVIDRLQKMGVKTAKPVTQHDIVYALPGAIDGSVDDCWLRVRTENDSEVTFTLKRSVVGQLDSIEHEVIVDSALEIEAIIKQLGFELYSDLTKTRQKARYGDIEICIDEVVGLGLFIEAEKVMPVGADHDIVVAELWDLFSQLKIDSKDEIHVGYDVLERAKRLGTSSQ